MGRDDTPGSGAPKSLHVARSLFFLNALVWSVLGVFTLIRTSASGANPPIIMWVIGVLMFGNAGAMLLAGLGLGMRRLLLWLFAMAVLLVNILLTFTDQVGILDWVTFAIDFVLVLLLFVNRSRYWPAR